MEIKYSTWYKGIPPQPIKLEVPGWAGGRNHNHGQPWHCKPFIDASTYGLELVYPFDTTAIVTTKDNKIYFEGDFSQEKLENQNWQKPFSAFAPFHFGFTSSLSIKTPTEYGTMILPHPRFYTDRTGTVPIPVAGFIETDFWPHVFFVVFKSPAEGQSYIFKKNEPYAMLLFLPKTPNYNAIAMSTQEMSEQVEMEKQISKYARFLSTKKWKTSTGETFDNKYKILSAINKKKGLKAVKEYISQKENEYENQKEVKEEKARNKMPRKFFNGKNKKN